MENTKEMDMSKKWKKFIAEEGGIKKIWTEPHTPQHNDVEQEIKIIKSKNLRIMKASNMPAQLWDFTMIHESELRSRTPRDKYPNIMEILPRNFIEQNTLNIS